jgi:hypothetical protein
MIDDLARRFAERSLSRAEWTHEAHLAVGLWHVREFGATEALSRLRTRICRLNESHGTANTTTSGYHETITRAYVGLLNEFLTRCPAERSLDEILADLLASPLAKRDALLAFYSRDHLYSATARLNWAEPDLAPIELARLTG